MPFHGWSSSGDQVLGESTLPRCGASYHHPGPSHSVSRARPSPGCRVSLLGGLISVCYPRRDVNRPESQEVLVRNWKPVSSLVGDAVSGAEFAPFLLWLVPACPLPPAGDGPVLSQLALLWYCSVLCSVSGRQGLQLGLFSG